MENNERERLENQVKEESKSALEEIIREGARRMLQSAIANEVDEYIEHFKDEKDINGRRLVVRNGSLPERQIITGIGSVSVKQPRIHDKRAGEDFSSNILPRYMRRVPSIDALIPVLYLKGISTGDFTKALDCILHFALYNEPNWLFLISSRTLGADRSVPWFHLRKEGRVNVQSLEIGKLHVIEGSKQKPPTILDANKNG